MLGYGEHGRVRMPQLPLPPGWRRDDGSSPALRVLGAGLEGTVGLGVEGGDGAGEGEDLGVGELLVELLKVELLGVGAAASLEKVGG